MSKRLGRRSTQHRRSRSWVGVAIAVIVVASATVAYLAYRATADLPGVKMSDQGNVHLRTTADSHDPYNSDPPTSGPHLPYIAPWGVHTRPIQRELQVHNLEDGGVIVQYNCECPELVAKLRDIVGQYDKQVILAPFPEMKSMIALTAWTRIETLSAFDARRIRRF